MGALGEAKARGVNTERKSGVKPLSGSVIKLTHFQQLLQQNWYLMYWVSFPLEHTGNAESEMLMHVQPRLSISSVQACTLERIHQRRHMVLTQSSQSQQMLYNGCKSMVS